MASRREGRPSLADQRPWPAAWRWWPWRRIAV